MTKRLIALTIENENRPTMYARLQTLKVLLSGMKNIDRLIEIEVKGNHRNLYSLYVTCLALR